MHVGELEIGRIEKEFKFDLNSFWVDLIMVLALFYFIIILSVRITTRFYILSSLSIISTPYHISITHFSNIPSSTFLGITLTILSFLPYSL